MQAVEGGQRLGHLHARVRHGEGAHLLGRPGAGLLQGGRGRWEPGNGRGASFFFLASRLRLAGNRTQRKGYAAPPFHLILIMRKFLNNIGFSAKAT